jgi:predicted transcriptional regulator
MKRRLTVKIEAGWRAGLRRAATLGKAKTYQGEVLSFQSAGAFFGKLTEKRWDLVRAMQGKDAMSIRAAAALVDRDVKRVYEDVSALIDLGLLERTDDGVVCPFATIHVDFELKAVA